MADVADRLKTSPLPICVTTSNLVVLHQRVYAQTEGTPKIREFVVPLLAVAAWLTPANTPVFDTCYPAEFCRYSSNSSSIIKDICL